MMQTRIVWRNAGLALGVALVALSMSGCSSSSNPWDNWKDTFGSVTVEASGTAGIKPSHTTCGQEQIEDLWARTDVFIGTVEVSNDLDYLYLKFEISEDLEEEWGMTKGFVQVGADATDYPQNGNTDPQPWNFDDKYYADPGVVVQEFTIPVEFSTIGLDHGACGVNLFVFAMATVTELNGEINGERAWASTDQIPTSAPTPPQMYYFEYEVQCCPWYDNQSEFTTHGQGGWGTECHGWNPGCYRNDWFDTAFPDGVTIGSDECDESDGYTMTFTSSEAIEAYLPCGGKPGPLEDDFEDPTERMEGGGGVLASQTLALALNLGFDEIDENFGSSEELLADQVICNTGTDFDGWTVGGLLEEANWILAGCESNYGPGEIVAILEIVNENYSDGGADNGYICSP